MVGVTSNMTAILYVVPDDFGLGNSGTRLDYINKAITRQETVTSK